MGLVHLYCGEGKGKTTAAVGLAVRCAGAGGRVVCTAKYGFFKFMSEEDKARARADYGALLTRALELARKGARLLVLDEAVSACNHEVIPQEELLRFLDSRPEELEVVITGRNPSAALEERADYITEMVKRRHPFDRGIAARKGVEF